MPETDPSDGVTASISASESDWSRERKGGGARLVRALRAYHGIGADGRRGRAPGGVVRRVIALRHRLWQAICGCDIPLGLNPGGGLTLPHPTGIVIHPKPVIGPNCILFQGVTLGTNRGPGAPRIGGHVDIGPGAKILGAITIGDHAVIGANAVVLQDVPAGATAVGIPARILTKDAP